MNRRQRRNAGHYGRAQHFAQAIRCPDCDSEVSVTRVAHRVFNAEIRHDDSCPWFRAFKRSGGLGVRFGRYEHPNQGQK